MSKEAEIIDALARRARDMVLDPAHPIAYPSVPFTPDQDAPAGKWLKADFFANRPRWEGLSAGVLDQGLFQLTVNWPHNLGIVGPNEVASAIIAHFPKGLVLIEGTTRVKVSRKPYTTSPVSEPGRVLVPVVIPWTA